MQAPPTSFKELVNLIIVSLEVTVIPLLIVITTLVIVWKLIDAWIINAEDVTKRDGAKMTAFIGVIVLAVILSLWGIIAILRDSIF